MASQPDTRMRTVTKKELIDRIAEQTGEKRVTVKRVVQSFLAVAVDHLGSGNRLEFRDFGVFEVRERKARVAQNPKTLERVEVPSKWSVRFKPGRLMRLATERLGKQSEQGHPNLKLNGHAAQFTEAKPAARAHTGVNS